MTIPDWVFITVVGISAFADIARLNGWDTAPVSDGALGFRILFRPSLYLGLAYWGGMFS
jgi:hypothetical protein